MQRAMQDVLAGLTFAGFGLAFAVGASSYEVGTTLRMGPGYFPLVLGAVLVVLGIIIVAKGFLASESGEAIGSIPWKATALIVGAVVFFGLTVRGLGVVPSIFVTVLLSGFAGRRTGLVLPVLIAVGLTIASVVIFVAALQLRLPLVGPWIAI